MRASAARLLGGYPEEAARVLPELLRSGDSLLRRNAVAALVRAAVERLRRERIARDR